MTQQSPRRRTPSAGCAFLPERGESPIVAAVDLRDAEQIDAAVRVISRILGQAVLGIYQYGSALSGGLRPLSDLDLLVVVDRPLQPAQSRELVGELLRSSIHPGSRSAGRPIEVTVVRRGAVSPWPTQPEREFQYGEWLRGDFENGVVPACVVDQDLAPLLFTALGRSHPLKGPPLNQLIDPIPHDALVTAMRAGVPGLLEELTEDTRNVLLTLARIWYTACTGDIVSKDAAASWALERIPPGPGADVLRQARAVYLDQQQKALDLTGSAVTEVAGFMAAHIGTDA